MVAGDVAGPPFATDQGGPVGEWAERLAGGTGLGKSMSEHFMRLGAHVVIWGRRGPVLDEAAAEMREATGGSCETMAVDIRNAGAIDEAMGAIFDAGPLTGLVNNAAGNFISRTEDSMAWAGETS